MTAFFDSRKTVFNTDIVDGVLYTQLDLAPERINHIEWYCDPALLPVIEAYGGAFEIGYTYDGSGDTIPTSDSNEWITVGSSATGQTVFDSFSQKTLSSFSLKKIYNGCRGGASLPVVNCWVVGKSAAEPRVLNSFSIAFA